MKKRIILLILLILIPVSVEAYECSDADAARLRKLASNVSTSYDYKEYDDYVTFSVTITNFNDDIHIVDDTTNNKYKSEGRTEITIDGYKPGTNIKYYIYNTRTDCIDDYLTVKYVNLPYYNKYYKTEICKDNNHNLCNKWRNVTISYDELEKQLSLKEKEIENIEDNNKKDILNIILDFINNYYYYIMGVLILTFILTELLMKKDSFDL